MHGYKTATVDILEYFKRLFGDSGQQLPTYCNICVDDILKINIDDDTIINKEKYPLLNRTLYHTLNYLYLRLIVEKTLVEKYNIDTDKYNKLGQIISTAYTNKKDVRKKVFLTSKKTLLNEFNHFESNMSIFQPALDITDTALTKEKTAILNFIKNEKDETSVSNVALYI